MPAPTGAISTYPAISSVDGANDLMEIVDVSDTSLAATGTNKKVTPAQIVGAVTQWGYVAAQFDKSADATLADVTGLSANLVAGTKYGVRIELFLAADATGGIAYTLGGTATVTIRWASELTNYAGPTLTPEPIKVGTGSGSAVTAAGGTSYRVVLTGAMTCTGSGTLTVQFSQDVANGTSSVLVGSWMQVVALT